MKLSVHCEVSHCQHSPHQVGPRGQGVVQFPQDARSQLRHLKNTVFQPVVNLGFFQDGVAIEMVLGKYPCEIASNGKCP